MAQDQFRQDVIRKAVLGITTRNLWKVVNPKR